MHNKQLITYLTIPLLGLCLLTLKPLLEFTSTKTVFFKITGYDPRDLFRGHYALYSVDYGVDTSKLVVNRGEAFICLDDRTMHAARPKSCETFIKGKYFMGIFNSGIEKFYIPESQAQEINQMLMDRGNQAMIKVKINKSGKAKVVDLLINQQSIENL